jgi:phosphoserine phosphatase RsbU/P
MFTDGVPEARRGGEFFDDDRLVALLAELRGEDAGTIADRIGDEVVRFQDGLPRDDLALTVLKVQRAGGLAAGAAGTARA